jgi:hypothetical protein
MADARYPIGPFEYRPGRSHNERLADIARIAALPDALRAAVTGMDDTLLDRSYREGGWTIRQLLHHLPDSHMNGYIRFKLALTEDTPTIKPYDEQQWSKLPDVFSVPVGVSLSLLDAIHVRWTSILESMRDEDFARAYVHPEHGRRIALDEALQSYAWHGDHHLAHIRTALG